jgi:hypothetical protein
MDKRQVSKKATNMERVSFQQRNDLFNPGHSTQYCTYTLMEKKTNKVFKKTKQPT